MCWLSLLFIAILTFAEGLYFFFTVVTGNWGSAFLSVLAYAFLALTIKLLGNFMSREGLC